MIDVVCFCGCTYSFEGATAACPRCGEPVTLTPPAADEDLGIDAGSDQLLGRPVVELPPEEMAA